MKKALTKQQQRAKQLRTHKLKQQLIIVLALFGVGAYMMYHIILLGSTVSKNPLNTVNQAQQQESK